jgi:hypothetical protein
MAGRSSYGYDKLRFVKMLGNAFSLADPEGYGSELVDDPIVYHGEDSYGIETLARGGRAINVTGDSLSAIAEEYVRLLDGEESEAEVTPR